MADDTAPIREDERFDEKRVAAYLRDELPDLVGDHPIEFDQFPGGAANLTYRARSGDSEFVLRRAPHGPIAKGGHDMRREHRVLSRLWKAYPKAPRSFHYCADPEVMGKPFFFMERRRGWVIRGEWPGPFAAEAALRRRLAESLVDSLAELHLVDPGAVGLGDLGQPEGFVARQVEGWSRRWAAARTRDVPDMEVAARLLGSEIPRVGPVSLLHNDYKLDNTMASDRGEVVAVLDWDMATRGDPLVDLGTLLAYWPDPNAPTFPIFGDLSVSLSPIMAKSEVVERYRAATGAELAGMQYYEGLALFRIAVIIEQIFARFVRGQTADSRFARFEPITPILARATCEVLDRPIASH